MSHHLVGTAEVARILGVSRQRVSQLAVTTEFPVPAAVLSAGRVWERTVIEAWAAGQPHRGPHRLEPDIPSSGTWPARVRQIADIANGEAISLGHDWVGIDHLFLSLVHPDCPGASRPVLGWLGIRYIDVRSALIDAVGTRESKGAGVVMAPSAQLVLERANLAAVRLVDEEVTSEHVLLALLEKWPLQYLADHLRAQSISAELLHHQLIWATEDTSTGVRLPPSPTPGNLVLARSAAGHDPLDRRPWGSALLPVGEGERIPGHPRVAQYYVDRDGHPVVTADGMLVHTMQGEDGRPVLDEGSGSPRLIPIEPPQGWQPPSRPPFPATSGTTGTAGRRRQS